MASKLQKKHDDDKAKLSIDMYEEDDRYVILAPIAGSKTEDIKLEVENEVLTIRGSRESHKINAGDNYIHEECYWGEFSREIVLPDEANPDNVSATFKNNILKIEIRKK